MLSDKFTLPSDGNHADSFERKERQDSINRFLDQAPLAKVKELLRACFCAQGPKSRPASPGHYYRKRLRFHSSPLLTS